MQNKPTLISGPSPGPRHFGVRRLLGLVAVLMSATWIAWAAVEQQQVAMESNLQERIEGLLSKTLPPNSYIVTVKVEMEERQAKTTTRAGRDGSPNNPFLQDQKFILPGVPEKRELRGRQAAPEAPIVNTALPETSVKRISINILVSPDVSDVQVKNIRELLTASLPFNPLRGDEMIIQASPLLKNASPNRTPSETVAIAQATEATVAPKTSLLKGSLSNTVLLGLIAGALLAFMTFLFGPVRMFFNRLLSVLPRVGEQAAFSGGMAPLAPPPQAQTAALQAVQERSHYAQGSTTEMPFQFIREEQLSKLPLVFREYTPQQVALVLAYLPPGWASRVLGQLTPDMQTAVLQELSQTHELPAAVVKDLETQLKERLPYLIGGSEWINSVYQLTEPRTQKLMLGSLNEQSPELAQTLRQKTFFFEDLGVLDVTALRTLVQEAGHTLLTLALKDEKPEFREAVLKKLPAAMRDIVLEELELSTDDKVATLDAKTRVSQIGRRLIQEGRLILPDKRKSA